MQRIFILLLLVYISFFSCTKRLCGCDPVATPVIKAVVIQENNIDCNRPVISIDHTDTAYFRSITGLSGDTFVANQLPQALKLSGQKLYITPGSFVPGEDFFCTTMGPSFPHLKIDIAIAR